MFWSNLQPEDFIPLFIFAIPIVAIAGGITAGIVKIIGQQRLLELAQRERIAAIERGLDPSKLPPPQSWGVDIVGPPSEHARRQAQGLLIGGLVLVATGVSLGVFLHLIAERSGVWAVGLIPGTIGIALLFSAWLLRPRGNGMAPPSA